MARNTPYHHGDLRNALITAGVQILLENGLDALSMRKLARAAGVSHNAPYMHFADKDALLAAIAEEGFRVLAERLLIAVTPPPADWFERLHAGTWAYVSFMLEHPGHAQVMFRHFTRETSPTLHEAALQCLRLLKDLLAQGQAAGYVEEGDAQDLAQMIWSMLHGMAILLSAEKMPPLADGEHDPQAITRRFVDQLYAGIRPRNPDERIEVHDQDS